MTNLNHPPITPLRRISEEEFHAIQRAHSGPGGVIDPMRMACSGESCRQGRAPCVTPDACCLSDDEDDSEFGALEGLAKGMPYIAAAWAVVAVAATAAWLKWWPL